MQIINPETFPSLSVTKAKWAKKYWENALLKEAKLMFHGDDLSSQVGMISDYLKKKKEIIRMLQVEMGEG